MATWQTYLYLAAFAILCIGGIIVQYKMRKTEENAEGVHAELNETIQPMNNSDIPANMSVTPGKCN